MIVLDSSSILAVLKKEPERDRFLEVIGDTGHALVSAGTVVELAAVAGRSRVLTARVTEFLNRPYARIEPVTAEQARMASAAFRAWGKGHHPAGLNLGDMFAYLLARERNLPLLFKGNDFSRTDVRNAMDEA